jgi:adenylate cyclase
MMRISQALLMRITAIGADPGDTPEVRLRKSILAFGSFFMIVASALWGALFIWLGEVIPGSMSLVYSGITLVSLYLFSRTRRHRLFRLTQLSLGLALPAADVLLMGGLTQSSAMILWCLISPLGALVLADLGYALRWWGAFFLVVLTLGLLSPSLATTNDLPEAWSNAIFTLNIIATSGLIAFTLVYFISQKEMAYRLLHVEEQKSERLLLNVLPREIAAILKNEDRLIAQQFSQASILFADLVNFTPLTEELSPEEMVTLLNDIFTHFDLLVEKYDLEKIRTIGDNYMVAAGVPRLRPDHAIAITKMAMDMSTFIQRIKKDGLPVDFRIGINSGPLVGGVIGKKKFVYDVWGDSVNVASRMESHGVPGKIQVSASTYELIKDEFRCTPRGTIAVKGKGEMQTWFVDAVTSREPNPPASSGAAPARTR